MWTISRWTAVPSWGLDAQSSRRFTLCRDDVLRVDAFGRAVDLRCEAGTVLVTRAGDLEDHVLEAGGRLRLRRGDRGVAWALTDAEATVEAADEDRPRAARWARALRWAQGPALLVAWLALAVAFVATAS